MIEKTFFRVRWQLRFSGDAQHLFHRPAHGRRRIRFVHELHDDRDRRKLADSIGAGQYAIAISGLPVRERLCLAAQHQLRKIDVPWMRRHIGTLRHEAEVAQIALIDDLPEIFLCDAVHFHRLAVVDEVEQRGKRAAQRYATAAAVTDIEDPLHLVVERLFVIEIGIAPIERVARRRIEIAFAERHGRLFRRSIVATF